MLHDLDGDSLLVLIVGANGFVYRPHASETDLPQYMVHAKSLTLE
jgi:hypothetical protein